MEFIRTFAELGKDDSAIAGGKGASLGEMTGAGVPVPPGFVVLAGAFERFLEETDLNVEIDSILHKVNHKEIHTVEKASEEIPEVMEGEVLVAPMTTPDYLPAMKRATAFVTDEGGITCHAAIVARELKKPCIIGTKIATKVLKDGDLVEVDANTGTVKIIKRARE